MSFVSRSAALEPLVAVQRNQPHFQGGLSPRSLATSGAAVLAVSQLLTGCANKAGDVVKTLPVVATCDHFSQEATPIINRIREVAHQANYGIAPPGVVVGCGKEAVTFTMERNPALLKQAPLLCSGFFQRLEVLGIQDQYDKLSSRLTPKLQQTAIIEPICTNPFPGPNTPEVSAFNRFKPSHPAG